MDFNANIINIKKLYSIVHGKDSEVILSYKGTDYGVTKPWHLRCDQREVNSESHDAAAQELFNILKKELKDKITITEKSANNLKTILNSLAN